MENKRFSSVSIIILAMCIICGSLWIGYSIGRKENPKTITSENKRVLTLPQAAEYLNMSEEEILEIIRLENTTLEKYHSFTGKMFPYFSIDNKKYFDKTQIDEWVKETSSNRREYDTKEGWIK